MKTKRHISYILVRLIRLEVERNQFEARCRSELIQVAEMLRQRRKEKRISRSDLAARMGISFAQLRYAELGGKKTTIKLAEDYLSAINR